LAAAVTLGPSHADPAPRADLAAELLAIGGVIPVVWPVVWPVAWPVAWPVVWPDIGSVIWPGIGPVMRIERDCRDLRGEELAHLLAQCLALGRQADDVEIELFRHDLHRAASMGHSSSAPLAATMAPSSAAHALSLPKSSRQAHSRRVKRCSVCSRVKP